MTAFTERYGPWAIVTGASAGIGEHFARQLAARGLNVALVARRERKLKDLADDLGQAHGVATRVIVADLSTADGAEETVRQTADLDVGLLVNNAGVGAPQRFTERDPATLLDQLRLNVETPLHLTRALVPRLVERSRGGVVLLSSVIAFNAAPFLVDYGAAKAYLRTLGQGLAYELGPRGVDVLVLTPGATKSESAAAMMGDAADRAMDTDVVVRAALDGLGRRTEVVPGALNKVMAAVNGRLLRPRAAARLNAAFITSNVPGLQ